MSNEIVISRYTESITWINKLLQNKWINKITIYNKGDNIELDNERVEIISLPNVGREGDTYLYHIITNYKNLYDNIWFLQADPFEHSNYFLNFFKHENLKKYINKPFQELSTKWKKKQNIPPKKYRYFNNSYNIIDNDLNDLTTEICTNVKYFIDSKTQQIVGHSYFYDNGVADKYNEFIKLYNNKNITTFLCEYLDIKPPKNIIPMCWSACFFSKKESILNHTVDVYKNLRNFLLNTNEQGYIEGYILERFWYYLFTLESYNNISEALSSLFINCKSSDILYSYNNKTKNLNYIKYNNIKKINNNLQIKQTEESYILYYDNNKLKCLPCVGFQINGCPLNGISLKNDNVKYRKCINILIAIDIILNNPLKNNQYYLNKYSNIVNKGIFMK